MSKTLKCILIILGILVIDQTLKILGREQTLKRLDAAIEWIGC